MVPLCLPLAVLLVLPWLVLPFADHAGPTALVGGCYLGYVAFLGAWVTRSQKAWLARIGQANLHVLVGWLALCGGQIIAGHDVEHCLFMLPLALFFLATICTLLEGVGRRRLQIKLREVMWWMAVVALAAAMSPTIVPGAQPDSPMAAVLLLVGVAFRLVVLSLFISFVAVPTLVVLDCGTPLQNKLIGLLLVCVAGAALQVMVLGGLSLVTGSFVGSRPEIFWNGLCLDLGVIVVIVGCVSCWFPGNGIRSFAPASP